MIHYYQNDYTGKLRIRMSLLIQLYGSVFRKMYLLVVKHLEWVSWILFPILMMVILPH